MAITCIATIGDKNDKEIESLLTKKLSSRYCIISVGENKILQKGTGYDILLCSLENVEQISLDSAIIILKEKCEICPKIVSKNSVIIAFAENTRQIAALSDVGLPVITCSGQKSTIAFSSNSDEGAVITLNRRIKSLSGRVIEPLEFPISMQGERVSDNSLYSFMALTAAQLMLDDFNSKLGKMF